MYSILLWFLPCLCLIYTSVGVGYNAGNKCGKGQYKSDFLSGGCAKCPKILKQCEDQEIDDARRCFIACKRRFSTIQPILSSKAAPQVQKSSTVFPGMTSTTNSPKIRKTIATQQVLNKLSSKKHDRFMHGTPVSSTSSYSPDEQTGDSNVTNIIMGVLFSFVALLLILAGCLCWWTWRRNTKEVQQSKYYYDAVPVQPRSNSNQSTNAEISSSTDEAAIDVDIEASSLSSSFEDFQMLPVTVV